MARIDGRGMSVVRDIENRPSRGALEVLDGTLKLRDIVVHVAQRSVVIPGTKQSTDRCPSPLGLLLPMIVVDVRDGPRGTRIVPVTQGSKADGTLPILSAPHGDPFGVRYAVAVGQAQDGPEARRRALLSHGEHRTMPQGGEGRDRAAEGTPARLAERLTPQPAAGPLAALPLCLRNRHPHHSAAQQYAHGTHLTTTIL